MVLTFGLISFPSISLAKPYIEVMNNKTNKSNKFVLSDSSADEKIPIPGSKWLCMFKRIPPSKTRKNYQIMCGVGGDKGQEAFVASTFMACLKDPAKAGKITDAPAFLSIADGKVSYTIIFQCR